MRLRILYPFLCILTAVGLYLLSAETPSAVTSTHSPLKTAEQTETSVAWYASDAVTPSSNNAWSPWASWTP